MKYLLMGTAMFMATMLFTNVYAITEEQNELITNGMLAVTEVGPLLDRVQAIMHACGAVMKFGIATEPCINFMINFQQSVQNVLDTYDGEMKNDPLNQPDSFLDIVKNTTDSIIQEYN